MPITLFTPDACARYSLPAGHPDQPDRLREIGDGLVASGLDMLLQYADAAPAGRNLLEAVHTPAYLQQLAATEPETGWAPLDRDPPLAPGSLAAAREAAGAAAASVDHVLDRKGPGQAFVLGRPPGHHAGPDHGGGFCLLNHAALAARQAAAHGLARIAIADIDVHHGDGTVECLGGDPRFRVASLYQAEGFGAPSGQAGAGWQATPLPPGTAGAEWRAAAQATFLPFLADFDPELIIVSAGFDGHGADDMGDWRLTEADFAWMAAQLDRLAPRSIWILEGGYAARALRRSILGVLKALIDPEAGI